MARLAVQSATDARRAIEAAYRGRTARSAALHDEALRLFPGGVTRSVTFHDPYPTYLAEECACQVTDGDGNQYLDLLNNFGLGRAVIAAVREAGAREQRASIATMPGDPRWN